MKINRTGAIGEIYTDLESGKMYKCTYSYKDSNGNVECEWKEITGEVTVEKSEIESEKIPEGKISENVSEYNEESANKVSVTKSSVSESNLVIEEKPVKEYPNHRPNKTRYTNYSKK